MAPQARTQPASIMVYVGLDLLGDGLMKLPFAFALRAAFPRARIVWVAGRGASVYASTLAPLVAGLIDEVIENAGLRRDAWNPLTPKPLAGRRFDLVIDTQRHVRTTLGLRRVAHGAFVSGAMGWILSDFRPASGTAKHAALSRQLMALVEAASGAPADARHLPPRDDPANDAEARRLLPDLPEGRVYVGLAPGAGRKDKIWPLTRFLEVGAAQAQAGRVPVVLLGPYERDWAQEVRAALPGALLPLPVDASPLLTVALAKRLAAAVANDSGQGHLLAAARTPLVSLFGPSDPAKFAPMTEPLVVVRAQDYGAQAMDGIPAAAVVAALDRLLAAKA